MNLTAVMFNKSGPSYQHPDPGRTFSNIALDDDGLLIWMKESHMIINGTLVLPTVPPIVKPHTMKAVVHAIKVYYTPSLVALGVTGNIIACVNFLYTAALRKESCNHYLVGAGVTDSLLLFGLLAAVWMPEVGLDIYNKPGWCQFLSFFNSVTMFMSLWMVIAYAVDLLIVNIWKDKKKQLCTPMRAKIVIIAIMVVGVVVYMNLSLTVGVLRFRGMSRCTPLPMFLQHLRWLSLLDGLFNMLLPYISLVIMILAISIKWSVNRHSHPQNVQSNVDNIQDDTVTSQEHCIMTVIFLTFFLVLRIPGETFRFIHIIRGISPNRYMVSRTEYYWQGILQNLLYANFGIKFLLYLLLYKHFRHGLLAMVKALLAKCGNIITNAEKDQMTIAPSDENSNGIVCV